MMPCTIHRGERGQVPGWNCTQKSIERGAVPRLRDAGAGGELAGAGGRGVAVVLSAWEEAAKRAAEPLRVGAAPLGAPAGTTFRTVEVREVLTSL